MTDSWRGWRSSGSVQDGCHEQGPEIPLVAVEFGPLWVGPFGARVYGRRLEIGRTALSILRELVRARGEPRTREQLLRAVWPTERTGQKKLDVHIHHLRRALALTTSDVTIVRKREGGLWLEVRRLPSVLLVCADEDAILAGLVHVKHVASPVEVECKTGWSLVVVDLAGNRLESLELLSLVRARDPSVPLLMLAPRFESADHQLAFAIGATYLIRPIPPATFTILAAGAAQRVPLTLAPISAGRSHPRAKYASCVVDSI